MERPLVNSRSEGYELLEANQNAVLFVAKQKGIRKVEQDGQGYESTFTVKYYEGKSLVATVEQLPFSRPTYLVCRKWHKLAMLGGNGFTWEAKKFERIRKLLLKRQRYARHI